MKNLFIFLVVASVFSLDASDKKQDRLASSLADCQRAVHLFNAAKYSAAAVMRAQGSNKRRGCQSLCMDVANAYPGSELFKAAGDCKELFEKRGGSPSNKVAAANRIIALAQDEIAAQEFLRKVEQAGRAAGVATKS